MLQDLLLCNSSFNFICGASHRFAIWRSVGNQRLCSWRSKLFLKCISVFISRIFLKLHIKCRTVTWYSRCTFGCDRPLIQDTLPEELATSWCRLGFCWRDFPHKSHLSVCVNLLKTTCDCLPIVIIKVCYLKSCVTGRLYLMPLYNCSWIHIRHYMYIRYKQCNCSCNQPHANCNFSGTAMKHLAVLLDAM